MSNQNQAIYGTARGYSPLIEAVRSVFTLVDAMKHAISQLSSDGLINRFSLLINRFKEEAEENGAKYDAIQVAKYCLCTFVDESAVRAGWADEHWVENGLLVSLYDETWGGERFFEILDTLKQDVNKSIDLIELMYLCLQFGHKGKYQVLTSGELEVDRIRRDLLAIIHSKRPDQMVSLLGSDPVVKNIVQEKQHLTIPLWVVGVLGGVMLSVAYFSMQWSLGDKFDTVSTRVNNLRLPVATPEYKEPTNFTCLRPSFENEIARKLVSVEDDPGRNTITTLGDGLFEPGSTPVQDQYYPVLAAVGQALNSVDGQAAVIGYTGNTPIQSLKYPSNWHLSQGRVNAVREILLSYMRNGASRIRSEGRGSTDLIAPNDSPENKARNRRVEITLFATDTNGPKLGRGTIIPGDAAPVQN